MTGCLLSISFYFSASLLLATVWAHVIVFRTLFMNPKWTDCISHIATSPRQVGWRNNFPHNQHSCLDHLQYHYLNHKVLAFLHPHYFLITYEQPIAFRVQRSTHEVISTWLTGREGHIDIKMKSSWHWLKFWA